jgi:hypothetical protein
MGYQRVVAAARGITVPGIAELRRFLLTGSLGFQVPSQWPMAYCQLPIALLPIACFLQRALYAPHLESEFLRESAAVSQRCKRAGSSGQLNFDVGINAFDEPLQFACWDELSWSVVHA